MSIADDVAFKQDRKDALASKDVAIIRLWAAKYGVKLPMDDDEILRLAALSPVWE